MSKITRFNNKCPPKQNDSISPDSKCPKTTFICIQVTKFYQANSIINSLVDQTIKNKHVSTIYVSLQLNKSVDSLIHRKFFCNNFGNQLIHKVFEKLIDDENKLLRPDFKLKIWINLFYLTCCRCPLLYHCLIQYELRHTVYQMEP